MSIADKLVTVAENVEKVYEAGKASGNGRYDEGVEAGKQEEQQTFWEIYQRGGRRTQYRYAFYDVCWTDENYNPKYPIICSALSSSAFEYSGITDTKVDITFSNANSTNVFRNCTALKTIRKLNVGAIGGVMFTNWFANCTALENIVVEGLIEMEFDIHWSPLTLDSLLSIINALSDKAADGLTCYLTIGEININKLSEAQLAVATQKGWTVV
ncbi:MAG: hypothetical protein IKU87_03015 [Clostridia bacterium]|nr:hypothetical protein [Clostridia bacterium]